MQEINQKTLKDSIIFDGIGLHNGKKVNLHLKPAEVNHGIKFKRVDLDDNNMLKLKDGKY